MEYRADNRSGNKLSPLGLGCMRFPRNIKGIDYTKSEKLVLSAIEKGINYFDTAYIYGGSEEILGRIIKNNPIRDKMYIATKLPFSKCREYGDFDRFFNIQLQRLNIDYVDYYLIHNLSDIKSWERLKNLGIEEWIRVKKQSGQIRQLGFSFHGSQSDFGELIDAYDWDFCQIQYNYVNTDYQAGTAGLKKIAEKGLPAIIMEPLLGGKLATGLPKKAAALFKKEDSSLTAAQWALKWLFDQKEVTVVLSGMGDINQLDENIAACESSFPGELSPRQHKMFSEVLEIFNSIYKIPCTGCNYCMPCPQNVNIPACFSAYNMSYATGIISGLQMYVTGTGVMGGKDSRASKCVKCGICETKCPQHIAISKSMGSVKKRLEPVWLNTVIALAKKFVF